MGVAGLHNTRITDSQIFQIKWTKWMMKSMGLEDSNLFSELEEVMKVDHLTVPDEVEPMQISDPINDNIHGPSIPKFYKTPIPQEAAGQLKSLSLQAEWLKKT